ncbi:MAG: sn-glycerol-1-phosphate dehydrogenase, partial [Eubacteriales bacterium]
VCGILEEAGLPYAKYIFRDEHLEPDEQAIGTLVTHFDPSCDLIICVGSGVINDIGKLISRISGRKQIIVGTAPSMDGYASATSSMLVDGLKISLSTKCPDLIIGDVDILKNAPMHMLRSGLGDMIAKYVGINEWRISHLITGEYYCERVAQLVRTALKKCVDHAEGLLRRDEEAVGAVFEGLIISGLAMAYAGMSRPASGVEHYFAHVWDMRGLEFGIPVDLHGIQCAVGTLASVRLYEALKTMKPDEAKARAYVESFDYEDWKRQLRGFVGKSAETMIALEEKDGKYNKETHPKRLQIIIDNWDRILKIIDEELPSSVELEKLMDTIGLPKDFASMHVDRECAQMTFRVTKDIRDKYILSRLAWDLGILDELCEVL